MAPCAKQFSLSLFLFLSLSSSFTNVIAGRYFFSKMMRTEKSSDTTAPQSSIPEENNNSTNFPLNSHGSGYGLYGRDPEQYAPTATTTTTTTTTDNPESVADEELFNKNVDVEYKNRFDNTNDDPYKFSNKFTEGRSYGPNYDQKNRRYQYGMSDTRFMENGRYYYDVNARRYGYGFKSDHPVTTNSDEYRSYGSYGGGDGTLGRYGNEANGNEYNKFGNENARSQEEYIP